LAGISIVGKQVLANIAIGYTGTGTVFASTSSNVVVGLGTDFANVRQVHIYMLNTVVMFKMHIC
jgi:hypothetical protein